MEAFEKAIELELDKVEYWTEKASALWKLKRLEEALESINKAIVIDGMHAPAWSRNGTILQALERKEEALASYDRAIELDPEFAGAYNNRGDVLDDLERREEALASYDRAIELDPEDTKAYNNRGAVLKDLEWKEEALASYDRAIELDPEFAYPWNGKAALKFEKGEFETAKIFLSRAFYLEQDELISKNLLSVLSRSSASPFLAFKVITQHLPTALFKNFSDFVTETFQASVPLLSYQLFQSLTSPDSREPNYSWNKWLGILHYRMGDPLVAHDILKRLTETEEGKTDLMAWYYLL